jgi:adenine C2-methylase RlmN of 23S rRNA A2503 and tRNA A37
MTDLPAAQRAQLVETFLPALATPLRTLEADRGTTRKTLWKLFDGALVESVLMRYPDRATMCVSSQAGCGMACPFCATGQGGLQRNMSTAEIVEQVAARCPAARPASPTSSSWAWGSRWPTTRRWSRRYDASPRPRPRGWA